MTTEQTPGWMFFAQDGSYGDAGGLRFVRGDNPALEDNDELPEDPRDREVCAFGIKHGTNELWLLTVEDTEGTHGSLHVTELDALEALRSNYLAEDCDPQDYAVDNDDLMQHLIDTQHLVIYLEAHPVPFLAGPGE